MGAAAGHATPEATAACAAPSARSVRALGEAAYGPLGTTGLTVSRIGFGGYRVDDRTPEHREALERALLAGVNLVDTSTNYTDGGSERLIGAVVGDLVRGGRLRREGLVLVSKIGYAQGQNLALAREREAAGRPFPEMVKYAEGIWHCIHPEFLRDQLARSLDRLGQTSLDVCLLHNPEYLLSDAKRRRDGALAAVRDELYRRLAEAFRFFEGEVAAGTLGWYGVSSNTVAARAADPEATSLTRMLAAAREAGGADHHFRVLQLPMNLFEAGGLMEPSDPPVLEHAAREGVGVLVNRPLNAIVGGAILRLADVRADGPEIPLGVQLDVVAQLEDEFRRGIAPEIRVSPAGPRPEAFFPWAQQLDGLRDRAQSLTQWEQIEGQVAALVAPVVRALDGALSGSVAERWRDWRERYLTELRRLLAELHRQAALRSQGTSRAVAAAIDPLLPVERRGETLSRKALWVLASTPGVSSVLTGARTAAYVDDALGVLRWPPLAGAGPAYEAVRGLRLARGEGGPSA